MGLDAAIGNRAKDNFNLSVDYSAIYKTSNEAEIRKLISLECLIIDWFNSLKDHEKEKLKSKAEDFSHFSDRELSEQRINRSEVLKEMFKPIYELKSYTIADDNSIGVFIQNNKDEKTENIIFRIPVERNLESHIDILIKELAEKNNKQKKDNKSIARVRKELEILGQVEQKEQVNR